MKFSEKLQTLRKENKMSQEQLADLMDVSRQSVSKWESGQAYPEMDKLLMLCKIFKCSLDDLTNDEVKTITLNKNTKITPSTLVDHFLHIVKLCYYKVISMNYKEIFKMILELIILFVLLRFLGIPFEFVADRFYNMFYRVDFLLFHYFARLVSFVILCIYVILAVIVFGYIFKLRYLDDFTYEPKEKKSDDIEKKEIKPAKNDEQKEVVVVQKETHNIIDFLVNVVLFFIKFLVLWIAFGLVIAFATVCGLFAFSIKVAISGVIFAGVILALLGVIVILAGLLEISFYFLFNHKIPVKRLFVTMLLSLFVVGIGGGLTAYDFTTYEYIDDLPKNIAFEEKIKSFTYTDGMYIEYWNVTYEEDKNLAKDEIQVVYSSTDYVQMSIELYDNSIDVGYTSYLNGKKMYKMILENMKEKKIYNYDIYHLPIVIKAHPKTIEVLKENYNQKKEEEKKAQHYHTYYENRIDNYELQINELEQENTYLNEKLEMVEEELQEYKDRIAELLN